MNYKIMNRKGAIAYTYKPHETKSIIISITSTGDYFPKFCSSVENNVVDILYLNFDDIDKMSNGKYSAFWKKGSNKILNKEEADYYKSFSDSEAQKIVKFINDYKNKVDEIICHCDAGISRSSGCCAAIMKALEGNDNLIFNSPAYHPNMTVYSALLKAFAQDGGYPAIYEKNIIKEVL